MKWVRKVTRIRIEGRWFGLNFFFSLFLFLFLSTLVKIVHKGGKLEWKRNDEKYAARKEEECV